MTQARGECGRGRFRPDGAEARGRRVPWAAGTAPGARHAAAAAAGPAESWSLLAGRMAGDLRSPNSADCLISCADGSGVSVTAGRVIYPQTAAGLAS